MIEKGGKTPKSKPERPTGLAPPPAPVDANVFNFRHSYDDVLGEFGAGARPEAGSSRPGATPPAPELSDEGARRILFIVLREMVESVDGAGHHSQDFRRERFPVTFVTSTLPGCLEWQNVNGSIEGIPWDRIYSWCSTRADTSTPYPPPPS